MEDFKIDQCIFSYLSHCKYEKGLSAHTLKAYQIDLKQFAKFIREKKAIQTKLPCSYTLLTYANNIKSKVKSGRLPVLRLFLVIWNTKAKLKKILLQS